MKFFYLQLMVLSISMLAIAQTTQHKDNPSYSRNSLQYALHQASLTHPELKTQKYTIDASKYSYESSKGTWLPSLNVRANIGPEKNTEKYMSTGRAKDKEHETLEVYQADIRQVLFDGGLRDSIIDQSHEQFTQSRYSFEETKEGIFFSVIATYVEILKQQKLQVLSEANYKRHKELYEKVKKRFDLKRETKVSLAQAQSRLLRAENSVVQSVNQLKQAKVTYRQLVGENPVPDLLDVSLKNFKMENNLFEAFRISEKHPALLRADSQITEARAGVQGAQSRFSPEIALEGSAAYDRYQSGRDLESENYSLLLTANWNLFNGFQDQKNYQASISRLYSSSSAKDTVKRQIFENVEDSWIELSKLRRNVEILDEQKDLAQYTADGYIEQYDKSSRSLFDVLNTQADAYSSEIAYISALYDEVVAFARLGFFMGDLSKRVVGYANNGKSNLNTKK